MSATSAPAHRRPFRLRSWDEHWRDLQRHPGAWLVIARNLVPVVGVLALGWSRPLVIFNFWFDGLIGLAAILTATVPRAVRETYKPEDSVAKVAVGGLVAWVVLVGFVCLPYWIVLIPLHDYLLDREMWAQIRTSPGLWVAFGGIAATHLVTAYRRGYGALPEREMKQALRWDAYLLVLKAIGMFILGIHLPMVLVVPALCLLNTYLELWPANALGAVWGDPSRLFEIDPGDSSGARAERPRSRDKRPPEQPHAGPPHDRRDARRERRARGALRR